MNPQTPQELYQEQIQLLLAQMKEDPAYAAGLMAQLEQLLKERHES
jgi:hypothetical protein